MRAKGPNCVRLHAPKRSATTLLRPQYFVRAEPELAPGAALKTLPDQAAKDAYTARVRAQSLNDIRRNIDVQADPLPPPPVLDFAPRPPRVIVPRPRRVVAPPPVYVPIARRKVFTEDLVTGLDVVDGRHKIDRMISCPHCKARVWLQEKTGGTKLRPLFSICCLQGRVDVPQIAADPGLLEFISEQSELIKLHAAKKYFPLFSKTFDYERFKQYWRGPIGFAIRTRVSESWKQSRGLWRKSRLC
ncbi:hypothetical protein BGZ95_006500 [Linnemannia exigua]|uniref:Uncharacterized protein n=1 Tax=Linnemannia exigua TaxID=604196 RepID=A0AAD4H125_9FUNG|nr:hypothetical protein BGZ95_006500 [Linnemannia exigua]